jgi:RNA polymerase primary sigma factor
MPTGTTDGARALTELYIRDIATVPLLTAEKEIELAQSIEKGEDARRMLQQCPDVSDEQRDQLENATARGEQARRQLTGANLRLVAGMARRYLNRGLPILDLIQEGNVGLSRAVERYDWRKGYRFSSYASWWIQQGITHALADQARPMRATTPMAAAIGNVSTWRATCSSS